MRALFALLFLFSAAALGCGDTFVDPFLRDGGVFSVYGVLEAGLPNEPPTQQTLRVQNVRTDAEPPRSPDDPRLVDRTEVITVDTFTGDSLRWTGRRTRFSDGTYGDLFSATFRPRRGGTYNLIVRRDDGRAATADLTLPPGPDGAVLPFEERGTRVIQPVAWAAADVDRASAVVEIGCGSFCGIVIQLDDLPVRDLGDGRIATDVDLTAAFAQATAQLAPEDPDEPPPTLTLARVRVDARLLGPEWAFADDPTRSTVRDGYGFVGTASLVERSYNPSAETARAAGFADAG